MGTEETLKELLHNIDEDIDVAKLTAESTLAEDVGMTSVALLYMAVNIEQEFGIDLSDVVMKDLKTVGDVVRMIEAKKA